MVLNFVMLATKELKEKTKKEKKSGKDQDG